MEIAHFLTPEIWILIAPFAEKVILNYIPI